MDYFAGIDVGSLSTEAVILDARNGLVGYSIIQTGANSTDAAEEALDKALVEANLRQGQIRSAVATGYGRISVPLADKKVTEISCHGMGAYHLFPDTGTVIDIGGQDSKFISFVGGVPIDYAMNVARRYAKQAKDHLEQAGTWADRLPRTSPRPPRLPSPQRSRESPGRRECATERGSP